MLKISKQLPSSSIDDAAIVSQVVLRHAAEQRANRRKFVTRYKQNGSPKTNNGNENPREDKRNRRWCQTTDERRCVDLAARCSTSCCCIIAIWRANRSLIFRSLFPVFSVLTLVFLFFVAKANVPRDHVALRTYRHRFRRVSLFGPFC